MTKERPFLAEPLRFLGIPLSPPLYYLWSMTIAQVELMAHDTSVTVYPKTDRCKGGRGGRREIEFGRMSRASMDVARQRWEKMQSDRKNRVDRGFRKEEHTPL